MSGTGSVLWAEAPDEEGDGEETSPESEAHGDIDETIAARRLRRWLKGMFGGEPRPAAEDDPGRKATN
jgi:hypothetical protein